jgi:hypothetical protein
MSRASSTMPRKTISTLLVLGSLLFITLGDRILPKPLSQYSSQTRNTLNQVILGLFPKDVPERPSKQREEQLEEMQRRANPSRQN